MLILHVTSSQLCLYLLNIYLLTYTFLHVHTEAHTHKHTCIISTPKEWRQPGIGAWLRGTEVNLLTVEFLLNTDSGYLLETKMGLAHKKSKKGGKKCQRKTDIRESEENDSST